MNQFHNQATHNKEFLDCIENQFEKFYDWKITVHFYIAIHMLKALAKNRNKNIGDTHHEIANSLDYTRTSKPVMQIPPGVWKTYKRMFQYSLSSRYHGIINVEIAELAMKNDLIESKKLFSQFCSYMKSEGINL